MVDVSVIIPMYNAENSISHCLSSVLGQRNAPSFEVIVVDDCSTDNSVKVVESLMAQHPNLRIVKCARGGVSKARNAGMDNASGRSICFVDSDDWVAGDYLSTLWNSLTPNVDIVASEAIDVDEAGKILGGRESSASKVFSLDDSYDPDSFYSHSTAWGCLYRTSVLEQVRFPSMSIGEDTLFYYSALAHATRAVHIPYRGYYYVQHDCSAMRKKGIEGALEEASAWMSVFELMREATPVAARKVLAIYAWKLSDAYLLMSNNKVQRRELSKAKLSHSAFSAGIRFAIKKLKIKRIYRLLFSYSCMAFNNLPGNTKK